MSICVDVGSVPQKWTNRGNGRFPVSGNLLRIWRGRRVWFAGLIISAKPSPRGGAEPSRKNVIVITLVSGQRIQLTCLQVDPENLLDVIAFPTCRRSRWVPNWASYLCLRDPPPPPSAALLLPNTASAGSCSLDQDPRSTLSWLPTSVSADPDRAKRTRLLPLPGSPMSDCVSCSTPYGLQMCIS
jgi:hypothetical protein